MKDNKISGKLKSMGFLRRNWHWIAFITIPILAAAILISLPYGIDYAAEQWLMSHGLEIASVEDVDFNPFTGTLVHRGWKVTEVSLPKLAEGHDAHIVAPAEVEL